MAAVITAIAMAAINRADIISSLFMASRPVTISNNLFIRKPIRTAADIIMAAITNNRKRNIITQIRVQYIIIRGHHITGLARRLALISAEVISAIAGAITAAQYLVAVDMVDIPAPCVAAGIATQVAAVTRL